MRTQLAALKTRFRHYLAERAGRTMPIELSHRSIYVLPTSFGWFFALMVFVSVMGALNYNNNLALLCAFLFGVLGAQSMLLSFRNLSRLRLVSIQAASSFAGERVPLSFAFESAVEAPRTSLNAYLADSRARFELALSYRALVPLAEAASRRGWHQPSVLTVDTAWPFGLFRAWTYLRPTHQVLIWPKPEASPPPLPLLKSKRLPRESDSGEDELRGLRPYVPGDALRRIAWKRSAGREDLMTRVFEAPAEPELRLSDRELGKLAYEARISRLAAWVEMAHAAQLEFELEVGGKRFGPDLGEAHRRRCLDALALLPFEATSQQSVRS